MTVTSTGKPEFNSQTELVTSTTTRKRWYILVVFSFLAFMEMAMWVTWGPIASSSKIVFSNWTDATIALLTNWGNIVYVLLVVPVCWLMHNKGLRLAVIMSGVISTIGAGLRCITMEPLPATILIHVGQILNSVGLIVVCAGPPLLSSVWFPPHQRTTATGISTGAGTLGMGLSALVGPLAMGNLYDSTYNGNFTSSENPGRNESVNPGYSREFIEDQSRRLYYLLCAEFVATALCTLCILIHFPDKPKSPPSLTATIERTDFLPGLRRLVTNSNVWLMSIPLSICNGVYGSWITMLTPLMQDTSVTQTKCGIIAFCALTVGGTVSCIITRLTDLLFRGMMKLVTICLLVASSIFFLWFFLMYLRVMPLVESQIYISVILGGTVSSCTVPFFYEIIAETAYPVAEGTVGGFVTGLFSFTAIIFLLIFFIPDIGVRWMNYTLLASQAIPIPMLILTPERYKRTKVDLGQ